MSFNLIYFGLTLISLIVLIWNWIKLGKKTDLLRIRRAFINPNIWIIQRKLFNKWWITYYDDYFSNHTYYFRKSTDAKNFIKNIDG